MGKGYVTTGQLAKAWGYNSVTIRRMCEDGLLEGSHKTRGKRGHWRIPSKHLGQENSKENEDEKTRQHQASTENQE